MGLGSFIGPAINAATQAAADYEGGLAKRADVQGGRQRDELLLRVQLQKQQQQQAIQQAIQARQAQSAAVEDHLRQLQGQKLQHDIEHPLIDPNSPEVFASKTAMERQKIQDEKTFGWHAPIRDNFTFLPSLDSETGKTVYAAGDKNSGQMKQTDVSLAPKGQGRGGAGSSQGAQVPVADLETRYNEIAQHAKDLAAGKWKVTAGMQSREGIDYGVTQENSGGHPNLLHMGTQAAMGGLGVGGKDYEHYQAMMNSSRSFGDDAAKVFKGRQNYQNILIEIAAATLTPSDFQNKAVVAQKLDRMRHIIELAKINNPAQAGLDETPSGDAPASGGSHVTVNGKTFVIPD